MTKLQDLKREGLWGIVDLCVGFRHASAWRGVELFRRVPSGAKDLWTGFFTVKHYAM